MYFLYSDHWPQCYFFTLIVIIVKGMKKLHHCFDAKAANIKDANIKGMDLF
jgi:hypothetical protein